MLKGKVVCLSTTTCCSGPVDQSRAESSPVQAAAHHTSIATHPSFKFFKSSVWQPAARGHRAYTDLSAARVRWPVLCTVCSLCQLGNDSLLNMVLYPLLDMRGGASLCKPLEIPGGFGVAPVKGFPSTSSRRCMVPWISYSDSMDWCSACHQWACCSALTWSRYVTDSHVNCQLTIGQYWEPKACRGHVCPCHCQHLCHA